MSDEDLAGAQWVEVRRFTDGLLAKITGDFLEEHGVEIRFHGSAAEAGVGAYGIVPDTRLLVQKSDLEAANEALIAFEREGQDATPYRDEGIRDEVAPEASAGGRVAQKKPLFAPVLALLVPIGGGHFYAQHGATALTLLAGMAACVAAGEPEALLGLLLADALFGYFATKRFNAGRVWSKKVQVATALPLVLAVVLLATDLPSDMRSVTLDCDRLLTSTDFSPVVVGASKVNGSVTATSCRTTFQTTESHLSDRSGYVLDVGAYSTKIAKARLHEPTLAITRPVNGLGDEAFRYEYGAPPLDGIDVNLGVELTRNTAGRDAHVCAIQARRGRVVVSVSTHCPGLPLEKLVATVLMRID